MTPQKILAFAIGPIGAALLSLATLPLITWLFPQEDVGRLSMLQVAMSFSTLLFCLGLDQAFVREFHETSNKPSLLKNAITPGLGLLLMALAILLCFDGILSQWLFGLPDLYLSFLAAFAIFLTFISRFLSLILRMEERGLAYSMSQLLPKLLLLTIVSSYAVLHINRDMTNLIIANVASVTTVCGIFLWNTKATWIPAFNASFDIKRLKQMLSFGLPLILGGVAFWGLTALDKVFLRSLAGFQELAIYSVAVSFAAATTILQSVFSTVWAPTVYKWVSKNEGLENIYQVNRYILAIVVLGFCLTGLFSWLITLFLPANYSQVQWIVISCIGYPLLYTLSETTVVGIGVSRRSAFSMLASIIALLCNLLGNWLLIPIFGAAGAAVTTCMSFWLFFFLRTEFSIYVWRWMPRKLMYSMTSLCVLGASLSTLIGDRITLWLNLFWLVLLISWIILFREEIKGALKFMRLTKYRHH